MNPLARLTSQTEGQGSILLRFGAYEIGRSSASDFYLDHQTVSRRHAAIVIYAQGLMTLNDRGSRNGTFVNGLPIQTRQLAMDARTLMFGSVVCTLDWLQSPVVDDAQTSTAGADPTPLIAPLSAAEDRVFTLLLDGLNEKTIAAKLRVSQHTIHSHVKRIYKHYRVRSRAELLANCLRKS